MKDDKDEIDYFFLPLDFQDFKMGICPAIDDKMFAVISIYLFCHLYFI